MQESCLSTRPLLHPCPSVTPQQKPRSPDAVESGVNKRCDEQGVHKCAQRARGAGGWTGGVRAAPPSMPMRSSQYRAKSAPIVRCSGSGQGRVSRRGERDAGEQDGRGGGGGKVVGLGCSLGRLVVLVRVPAAHDARLGEAVPGELGHVGQHVVVEVAKRVAVNRRCEHKV